MTTFIGLISGKGGVGKTTTTVNTAAALQMYGRGVVLIDGNLTAPHIGLYLGVPMTNKTVHDVMMGSKQKIHEIAFVHSSGLKVIPASISFQHMKLSDFSKFQIAVKQLENYAEIVMIDCPAGFGEASKAIMDVADYLIIVTNPEIPAISDALKCVKLAEELKTPILGIIVNKSRDDGYDIPIKSIEAILEHKIIGIIPDDLNIRKSVSLRTPLIHVEPKSPASDSYRKIGKYIIDNCLGKK